MHEEALQQRVDDERTCVADVDTAVHRGSTGIDRDPPRLAGF
jgi:hypothetical protein